MQCPTFSLYKQTLLPTGSNPNGIQRNDTWQMDVFHLREFVKLKYVHPTTDTYSGFQWATTLASEKVVSVITHLLEERIHKEIKMDKVWNMSLIR